jgi:uncharacterized membrane protein YgaE (UPF0421/DUF939 family)
MQSMIELVAGISAFVFNTSRRIKMDKKYGFYVLLGVVIGIVFGIGFGSANGNVPLGLGIGILTGVFAVWFLAAANLP